jgi:hypothetical protein
MFSFQAFVLKGSHHHLGSENFNKIKNNQKNIKSGITSIIIPDRKLSFSVFMFI